MDRKFNLALHNGHWVERNKTTQALSSPSAKFRRALSKGVVTFPAYLTEVCWKRLFSLALDKIYSGLQGYIT